MLKSFGVGQHEKAVVSERERPFSVRSAVGILPGLGGRSGRPVGRRGESGDRRERRHRGGGRRRDRSGDRRRGGRIRRRSRRDGRAGRGLCRNGGGSRLLHLRAGAAAAYQRRGEEDTHSQSLCFHTGVTLPYESIVNKSILNDTSFSGFCKAVARGRPGFIRRFIRKTHTKNIFEYASEACIITKAELPQQKPTKGASGYVSFHRLSQSQGRG